MDRQTPGIGQELSTAPGRRIWGVTLGVAALLLLATLAFLIIRNYFTPTPATRPAPKIQTSQP